MLKCLLRLFLFTSVIFLSTGASDDVEAFSNSAINLGKTGKHQQQDPVITASGPLNLCPGGNVTLTATDAPTGASYQWFRDGNYINGATNATYTASVAGSYYVVINFAGTDTTYAPVTVTSNPTPSVSFTNQNINACNASIVKFTSTSTGSNLKYLWSFGDPNSGTGDTSTFANPVHKFIGSSTAASQYFTVRLTVTSDAGCSNSTTASVYKAVSSAQLGGLNPSVYNGKQYFSVCGNSVATEFTFTNKSTTTALNTNYNISWGDGTTDYNSTTFGAPLKHTYNAGNYTLTYIVSEQGTCKDTLQYGVFVGTNPAVGLGNPGNTVICTGSALTFPVTGTANNPAGTLYTVTYSDGTPSRIYTSAPDTITHYFLKSSCGYYSGSYNNSFSATIVASNPCNSSTATVTPIYVSQKPKASFSVSPSEIVCTGNTTTFTNTSQGNTASNGTCTNNSFVWSVSPATGYAVYSGSLGNDFGSDQASLWTNGSTYLYLRFTTPGTYTVKLRTGGSNCGNDVVTRTICVTAPPVASFTVDNSSGCSPLAVKTNNASPTATCGANSYRWTVSPSTGFTLANNTTLTSANTEFNFTNAGTYTLSLVATSPGGGCVSNTATQTITVKTKPAFTLNAVGNICVGSSLSPTATVTAGTGLTYAWVFEGGTPATSALANPGTVVYSATGNYTTTLTITNDCGATTLTNNVVVKEAPTITAQPDISFCSGASSGNIVFAGGPTGVTFAWRNDNANIGLATNGSGIINSFTTRNTGLAPIVGNITVTPTNNGCVGTPVSFKITVNPKPAAPTVTPTVNYCVNDVGVQLMAIANTGNTLNWYSNATLTNKLTDAPIPATTTAGSTTYYVAQTNTFGCESAAAGITVIVSPGIGNNVVTADQTICYNSIPAQLRGAGSPSGGSGIYTYQWQSSADGTNWANITGATAATYTPPGLTASTQYRRLVSSGNCSLASNAVRITVQGLLSNYDIGSSQTICYNNTPALLTGQLPVGGNGVFVYQWQSSANNISWTNINGATASNYQPAALTATTYFRRLTASGICSGFSSAVAITVNPNAKAEFTAVNTIGCIPFDLSKVIKPVLHDDQNGSYEWFANGVSIGKTAAFPGYVMNSDGATVNIRLFTTSKSGCDTSGQQLNFNTVKTVSASFTKEQTKGCGPITAHFVNTSQPLNSGTYKWDFGNGQTSTQTQPNDVTFLPHPQNRDTTYKITLAVSTSCGVNYFTDSIRVRPKPKAVFTPDKTIGCSPFEITLTNQSAGLPNTYTYYFGNGDKQVLTDNQTIKYTYTTTKTDTLTLKLVAENECGKDSSFYKIVVYPNNVQAKLVVNGDNQFGCSPVTVNFYNNSTGANSFLWDFSDGNTTTTSKTPDVFVHTFTKPGVYNVKLTASNGCTTASTSQIITVYPQPLASFSIPKLQYCLRDSVAFINNSTTGNFFYRWDFGDGSVSNDNNPKHAYAKPGKYIITLTLTQSYANGSACTNTVSHTTEILAAPDAAFLSNAGTLNCAPFNLNVVAAPVNALSPVWDFGDVASGTANQAAGYSANHIFTKPGLYRVLLTTYNQTGCADSTAQLVRITESPLVAFSPGDTVLCGTTATVNFNNKTTYNGLVNYRWFINNILVSSQKNLVYTFNPPANAAFPFRYQIKLIATGTSSCPDTVSHNILLNGFPKAVFSVKNVTGCAPFKAEILNTSLYADQFKWYLNNKLISTYQNPQNIILSQSATSYQLKLVASSTFGCRADSSTITIGTFAKPVAAFILKDSLSCNGRLDINITNKTTGATSYVWNFGDGTAEATTATPLHTYGVPGTYYLRLIAYNGFCRDTLIHTIKIALPPQAAFTANNLKGCTQVTATFQNISNNAVTYLWDFGDGTFSSGKNPTHTFNYPKSPFTVKLVATGEYGCADTTIMANYIVVSAPPKADFAVLPDSVIKIPNYTFNFTNKSTGKLTSIKWDFGDGKTATADNPQHIYLDTGSYKVKLTVINTDNCTDGIARTVKVVGVPGYLFVPNAFEPGNGKTELKTFAVRASGLSAYSLRIFNKWGEVIWQSDKLDANGSPTEGWDGMMHGQPAPQGVYVWYISAKFINGTEWKGMKYETGSSTKTGPIHLIR